MTRGYGPWAVRSKPEPDPPAWQGCAYIIGFLVVFTIIGGVIAWTT